MDICRRSFGATLLAGLAGSAFGQPFRPKLLVIVLIEQLGPELLEQSASQFSPGGFRRVLEKGAWFPNCRHLASTFSSSTIATLATGCWPSQHGIVADHWYDTGARAVAPATADALLATTLASQAISERDGRVFVVSLERESAALWAGTREANLFWMDAGGRFTTTAPAPGWVEAFNKAKPAEKLREAHWMAVDARPGAPPLRTLYYDAKKPAEFMALYKASPFAQEAQFDFVEELIGQEGLGRSDGLDIVCVLAQSTSLLGFETGGRSPLLQQMALHLDESLESLLTVLGKTVGESGFNIAIAGGHGAPPEPPEAARARMAVNGEQLAKSIDAAMGERGGKVRKYVYPFVYLDTSGFMDAEPIRLDAARAALDHPAVAGYLTAGGACSMYGDWVARFRNSFHAKRSGDVMLSYRPDYVEDFGAGRGISYGSLYNYDVRVPLVFYGPQFRPGVYESPVESVDVAPTLARALGMAPPSAATGRVLGEALARR